MLISRKIRTLASAVASNPLPFAALIVVIDQAAKIAVKGFNLFGIHRTGMQLYESKEVLGDFLRFTYVENPGMAFGLNFGMPVILSCFSIAASIFLMFLIRRNIREKGNIGLRFAFALILGGAAGNLIDRALYGVFYGYAPLFYGRVVDFVDVNIPDMHVLGNELHRFYVFNIADAAVTVGVVLLLFFYPSKRAVMLESGHAGNEQPAAGLPVDGQPVDGQPGDEHSVDGEPADGTPATGLHNSSTTEMPATYNQPIPGINWAERK